MSVDKWQNLFFSITHLFCLCLFPLGCENVETRRDRFFTQGNKAIESQAYETAISLYTKAIKIDSDHADSFNNRGVAKRELGRVYEAIQDYNDALLIDDKFWDCLHNRAMAYHEIGNLKKSIRDYDLLIANHDTSLYHKAKALIFTDLKDYMRAIDEFNKVLVENPNDIEVKINLATLDFYLGNNQRAAASLEGILRESDNSAFGYNTLNQIYLESSSLDLAYRAIDQALRLDPNNPFFLNNRGFTYLKMDSMNLAIKDINQSILLDPENPWSYRNKGYYYYKMGDFNRAIRYLKQSLEMDEDVKEAHLMLGMTYLSDDQLILACQAWEIALDLGNKKAQTYLNFYCN